MNYTKKFTVSLLLILLGLSLGVYAQSVPACEIAVTANAVPASRGSRDGEIQLVFEPSVNFNDLKIFITATGSKEVGQVDANPVKGLKAGFYDLLIIDPSRKECVKQVTVEVKSK